MMSIRMTRLSIAECESFFKHYYQGLLNEGLIKPLQSFRTENPKLKSAIHSWEKSVTEGLSFRESLKAMSPQFPSCVDELLTLAAERSVLDYAVADLLTAYSQSTGEINLLESTTRLVNTYSSSATGGIICEGCFERDFLKIMSRATLEQADEVILEQEGESYFHQKYLGVKLIHVIEPCHSMLYNTIQMKLGDAISTKKLHLAGVNRSYSVEQTHSNQYIIKDNNQHLTITLE
ncbi:MAG: hypothetical protein GQ565_11780 [Candidatus Aegiribacteria sp.]|nr:hypothetical protein [Candidatus Aegiribacteria sp.]